MPSQSDIPIPRTGRAGALGQVIPFPLVKDLAATIPAIAAPGDLVSLRAAAGSPVAPMRRILNALKRYWREFDRLRDGTAFPGMR